MNNYYWKVKRILAEKVLQNKIYYLAQWEGEDENGLPWDPTWVIFWFK
ncbi:hypothetical protein GvMRE_IIg248 [endosymbiont GvMRE of Glomus versiforme]|nr:hypothetical protein GvMRE_IIg248 [endosymbiont GvMRE of Glomus versiforme]